MTPEHEAIRDQLAASYDDAMGEPRTPELAQGRTVVAASALMSLHALSIGGGPVDPVVADWLTPTVADLLDQIAGNLAELYEQIGLAEDETTILEPGTLTEQPLVDLPVTPRNAPQHGIGPQGVPRGELIR